MPKYKCSALWEVGAKAGFCQALLIDREKCYSITVYPQDLMLNVAHATTNCIAKAFFNESTSDIIQKNNCAKPLLISNSEFGNLSIDY